MSYGKPTAKAVLGLVLAYGGDVFLADPATPRETLLAGIAGLVVVIGVSLVFHGLFTGIESAVAAGREGSDAAGSRKTR